MLFFICVGSAGARKRRRPARCWSGVVAALAGRERKGRAGQAGCAGPGKSAWYSMHTDRRADTCLHPLVPQPEPSPTARCRHRHRHYAGRGRWGWNWPAPRSVEQHGPRPSKARRRRQETGEQCRTDFSLSSNRAAKYKCTQEDGIVED